MSTGEHCSPLRRGRGTIPHTKTPLRGTSPRSGVRIYLRNTQKVQLKCISTGMRYSGASSGPQLPEPMPLW